MFTVISADDRSRPVPAGRGAAAGILKQGQTCERPRTFAGVGRGAPSWGRINRLRFLSPPAAQQAPGGPTYSRPSKRARIVDRVSPLSDRRNPGLQPARDRPAGWPSEDDGAGGFSFNRSCRSAQSKPVMVFGSVAKLVDARRIRRPGYSFRACRFDPCRSLSWGRISRAAVSTQCGVPCLGLAGSRTKRPAFVFAPGGVCETRRDCPR